MVLEYERVEDDNPDVVDVTMEKEAFERGGNTLVDEGWAWNGNNNVDGGETTEHWPTTAHALDPAMAKSADGLFFNKFGCICQDLE